MSLQRQYEEGEVDQMEEFCDNFTDYYEFHIYKRDYRRLHMCLPVMHTARHVAEQTRRLGPLTHATEWPIERIIRFVRKLIHSMGHPNENLENRIYYSQMLNTLLYVLPIPPGTSRTFDQLIEKGKFDDEAGNFDPIRFFHYAMAADLEEMVDRLEEGIPDNHILNGPLFDIDEPWYPPGLEEQLRALEEDILEVDDFGDADVTHVEKKAELKYKLPDVLITDREKNTILRTLLDMGKVTQDFINTNLGNNAIQKKTFIDSLNPMKWKTLVLARRDAISEPLAFSTDFVRCQEGTDERTKYDISNMLYFHEDGAGRRRVRYGSVVSFITLDDPSAVNETLSLAFVRRIPHETVADGLFVRESVKGSRALELIRVSAIECCVCDNIMDLKSLADMVEGAIEETQAEFDKAKRKAQARLEGVLGCIRKAQEQEGGGISDANSKSVSDGNEKASKQMPKDAESDPAGKDNTTSARSKPPAYTYGKNGNKRPLDTSSPISPHTSTTPKTKTTGTTSRPEPTVIGKASRSTASSISTISSKATKPAPRVIEPPPPRNQRKKRKGAGKQAAKTGASDKLSSDGWKGLSSQTEDAQQQCEEEEDGSDEDEDDSKGGKSSAGREMAILMGVETEEEARQLKSKLRIHIQKKHETVLKKAWTSYLSLKRERLLKSIHKHFVVPEKLDWSLDTLERILMTMTQDKVKNDEKARRKELLTKYNIQLVGRHPRGTSTKMLQDAARQARLNSCKASPSRKNGKQEGAEDEEEEVEPQETEVESARAKDGKAGSEVEDIPSSPPRRRLPEKSAETPKFPEEDENIYDEDGEVCMVVWLGKLDPVEMLVPVYTFDEQAIYDDWLRTVFPTWDPNQHIIKCLPLDPDLIQEGAEAWNAAFVDEWERIIEKGAAYQGVRVFLEPVVSFPCMSYPI
ncbi:hypothetical protein BJ508DRAFT_314590 [Ascobolus immersus RN42]|uniref:Uncharacterized protein n=1 Tax=Ascobolus immersus RN42 TaxID=1160509 RepID=A0A3N4HSD2_ASCIM|nr:hypothetical protein BJ508DRAFT_314590 [Ascobolus immersus RN42]